VRVFETAWAAPPPDLEPAPVGPAVVQLLGASPISRLIRPPRRNGSRPWRSSTAAEALWGRTDLAVRTTLCDLHESAAPVKAVLALNVEDLDLADRRARVGRHWSLAV
jgi:hypothetical protein